MRLGNITELVRLSNRTVLLPPITNHYLEIYRGNCEVHKGTLQYIKLTKNIHCRIQNSERRIQNIGHSTQKLMYIKLPIDL